jgi:hypothetical protein
MSHTRNKFVSFNYLCQLTNDIYQLVVCIHHLQSKTPLLYYFPISSSWERPVSTLPSTNNITLAPLFYFSFLVSSTLLLLAAEACSPSLSPSSPSLFPYTLLSTPLFFHFLHILATSLLFNLDLSSFSSSSSSSPPPHSFALLTALWSLQVSDLPFDRVF